MVLTVLMMDVENVVQSKTVLINLVQDMDMLLDMNSTEMGKEVVKVME